MKRLTLLILAALGIHVWAHTGSTWQPRNEDFLAQLEKSADFAETGWKVISHMNASEIRLVSEQLKSRMTQEELVALAAALETVRGQSVPSSADELKSYMQAGGIGNSNKIACGVNPVYATAVELCKRTAVYGAYGVAGATSLVVVGAFLLSFFGG